MNKFVYLMMLMILVGGGLIASHPAFAHGGEIAVGGGARGPVHLTAAQQTAIDLKTVPAGMRPLAKLLNINGEVKLLPDRQADVSVRISGQIKELSAGLGDRVLKGQKLALVEGRTFGSSNVPVNAPISGIIDARNVILGQTVEPDTKLFHISDISQMVVSGKVYEEDLALVKIGQEAHVRLLAYPDKLFVGKVTLIEPTLDPSSRTVKTWVQLDNPQGLLKADMFARIGLVLQKNDQALAIPNDAIIEANGEKFVFVKTRETFNRVDIKTGAADDEFSEVADGLVPGDEVVTQGSREVYTMWLTGGQIKSDDKD